MLGLDVPEVVLGAGAMGVFAFAMLGMGWKIIQGQQRFIYNHMSEGTKALVELKASVDRLADKL